jgi:methyl-accepting chemotaxis protein
MNYVWDLKIATKIVGMLVMLGLVVMVVAWYGSSTLRAADADYSELTDHRLPSTTKLARVVRMAVTMDLSAYRAMAYDGASAQAKSAEGAEQTAYGQAIDLINKIHVDLPAMADRIRPVRTSVDQLHELTRQAIALGRQNRNDEARVVLTKADALIDVLAPTIVALNDEIIGGAKTTSDALSARSSTTSTMMLLGGALAVILAGGWLLRVSASRVHSIG